MRILWLNHRDILSPSSGGAERTIYEVARRLVRQGAEVTWLASRRPGLARAEFVDGIRIIRGAGTAGPHVRSILELHAAHRPDVVVDDLAQVIPWCSPWLGSQPGTVFFRHLHRRTLDGQVRQPLAGVLKWMERRYPFLYRDWKFVTETKRSVADLKSLGITEERCVVITPGVDTQFFAPGNVARDPLIVYFGGFRAYKRPDHVLHIAAALNKKRIRCRFVLVGDGPLLRDMIRLSDQLKVTSMVSFLGRVSRDELVSIVRTASINLHTSIAEGWCLSALEAAACGVPTAGYAVPGLSESVRDGVTGRLVPDGNIQALAEAIESILAQPDAWRTECRHYSLSFSWEKSARSWYQHLDRITASDQDRSK